MKYIIVLLTSSYVHQTIERVATDIHSITRLRDLDNVEFVILKKKDDHSLRAMFAARFGDVLKEKDLTVAYAPVHNVLELEINCDPLSKSQDNVIIIYDTISESELALKFANVRYAVNTSNILLYHI